MISIKVGHQFLFIPKGTSIQIEMNNSLFDTDKIEGEIIYTFEVPAEHNAIVFDNANKLYVNTKRKFDCIVYAGGIEIAHGDLYIQSATGQSYSIGVVMNPYPEGWADQDMGNDDFGEDLIISTHLDEATRKTEFLQFLKQTVDNGSIVKFPLFYDEDFYGDSNKDFGFFLSPFDMATINSPGGIQASIHTSSGNQTAFDKYYVNRLFVDGNGDVIEALNNFNRGIRVFNRTDVCNGNSFSFAPAISLVWIIDKLCHSAGYSPQGNFLVNENVKKIYHQSMYALDDDMDKGNSIQFKIDKNIEKIYGDINHAIKFIETDTNKKFCSFKALESGQHDISLSLQFFMKDGLTVEPIDYIDNHSYPDQYIHRYDLLVVAIFDTKQNIQFIPDYITKHDLEYQIYRETFWHTNNDSAPKAAALFDKNHPINPYHLGSLSTTGDDVYVLNTHLYCNLDIGHEYIIVIYKIKCRSYYDSTDQPGWMKFIDSDESSIAFMNDNLTSGKIVTNTFSNSIHWSNHMPSLSNSDFLNSVCNAFGLNYFINSTTKEIELSFFKDILHSKNLDLSDYLLDRETTIENIDEQIYKFILKTELDENIDTKEHCDEVLEKRPVPNAKDNVGKLCFIKNLNKYQISEKKGNSVIAQYFEWKDYSGNVKSLKFGETGDIKEIAPPIIIPYLRSSWNNEWAGGGTDTHIIPQLNKKCISKIFDTKENEQDLILLNCHGLEKIDLEAIDGGGIVRYEFASPVCWRMEPSDENDMISGINLTTTGSNSIGDTYVKPVLKLLQGYTKVTAKFILPLYKFLETSELLKPQNKLPHLQTRWILINNTRLLPIKMTFEFAQGRDQVLAEIEMALPKVGI